MEKRSDRMKPIKDLIELKEKNMARQLAECQRTLAERTTRLKELIHYRDSYLEQKISSETASAVHLQEYQFFINKLNNTIKEQQHLVDTAQVDLDTIHAQWADMKARSSAVGKAVDRFRQTEQIHQSRLEQKENDEIAATRFTKPKN